MTTTDISTRIQVRHLDELNISSYRSFKSAVLQDPAGVILAQVDTDPEETDTYLQYRLLATALEHRQLDSSGKSIALGLKHGGVLTVYTGSELADFELPDEDPNGCFELNGEEVLRDGRALRRKTVAPEELL